LPESAVDSGKLAGQINATPDLPLPARKRRKRLTATLAAAVVLTGLAVALVLTMPSKPSQPTDLPAPDFLSEPTVNGPFDLANGLPQDVSLGWIDETGLPGIGVAMLTLPQPCTSEECLAERLWLRGVNLTDGTILWTISLEGIDETNLLVSTANDPGSGRLAVLSYPEAPSVTSENGDLAAYSRGSVMVLDSQSGKVIDSADLDFTSEPFGSQFRYGPTLLAFTGSMVVIGGLSDHSQNTMVGGFSVGDLSQSRWTAPDIEANNWGASDRTVFGQWVLTANGYVSIAAGAPASWGGDAVLSTDEWGYTNYPVILYRSLPDGTVIRVEATSDSEAQCVAWNTATNQPLWDHATACALFDVPQLQADRLVFGSGNPESSCTMVSLEDGLVLWQLDNCWAIRLAGSALVTEHWNEDFTHTYISVWNSQTDPRHNVVSWFERTLQLPSTSGWVQAVGNAVIYTMQWDEQSGTSALVAWPIDVPSDTALWSIDLAETEHFWLSSGTIIIADFDNPMFKVLSNSTADSSN